MNTQPQFHLSTPIESVETYEFEPIQGYPMLNWKGKRPFRATQYDPAQLKETHGEAVDDWRNRIYWGDNLQVMSHLLKTYRGQIALIYIDPPFDSRIEYKKKIRLKGKDAENNLSSFEDKQKALYDLKEFEHVEAEEIELVKAPEAGYYNVRANPTMVITEDNPVARNYGQKSFHLDTYAFDSKPEQDLFWYLLREGKVKEIYFTGMLTHGQSDFYIQYIDPDSHTVKRYYPDFLIQKEDGSWVIVEGRQRMREWIILGLGAHGPEMADEPGCVLGSPREITGLESVANDNRLISRSKSQRPSRYPLM